MNKVLIRVLVKEFYRANVGFFLIGTVLLFGFLKTPQHLDIAAALAANPIYYLILFGLWSIYALKTYLFAHRIKRLPANTFLSDLVMLQPNRRKPGVIFLQLLLLLPALGYGLFLAVIAIQTGRLDSAAWVIVGNLLVLMISAHFLHLKLIQPVDAKSTNKYTSWTQRMPSALGTLFIHQLFNRYPLPFLFTKLFSLAIIIGSSMLFEASGHDLRLLTLGILLAASFNSMLTLRHVHFNANELWIFQNLPIRFSKKFITNVFTYMLLMIPEIIVLIGNNLSDLAILHLLKIIVLLFSLMILFHAIAQSIKADMDRYVKYIFFISATLFFVVLGYVEPLIIAGILVAVSFFLWKKSSYPIEVNNN